MLACLLATSVTSYGINKKIDKTHYFGQTLESSEKNGQGFHVTIENHAWYYPMKLYIKESKCWHDHDFGKPPKIFYIFPGDSQTFYTEKDGHGSSCVMHDGYIYIGDAGSEFWYDKVGFEIFHSPASWPTSSTTKFILHNVPSHKKEETIEVHQGDYGGYKLIWDGWTYKLEDNPKL